MNNKYTFNKILYIIYRKALTSIFLFLNRLANTPIYLFKKDIILIVSSISPISKNWGDDVSIQIVKCINPNLYIIPYKYIWDFNKKSNYLCIGSIVSWMTNPQSIIWGSGCVYPQNKIKAHPNKVLAVRGPLTRNYLIKQGIDCPEIYGDPALLFPRYYTPPTLKRYKLGIIPHFRDKDNPIIEKLSQSKEQISFIDVQDVNDWRKFIDRINECEFICSSSLHGIIISDAYRIPNIWCEFKDGEKKSFAFHDYFLSVQKDIESPFYITESTKTEDIITQCKNWKEPQIDLEKLLSVCPFLHKS